jgi:alkaline phosphatase
MTPALIAAMLAGCATAPASRAQSALPQRDDPYFQAAAARISARPPTRHARNVIIFIGDGMGVSTVTATRIYAGQQRGVDGESYELAMDTFPHVALSRTYGHDAQISDSAPTATAILSGVKTGVGIVGLSSGATPGACEGSENYIARSLLELAEDDGLSTGIVTTVTVTHATPAASYAHAASRGWQNDAALASDSGGDCIDIARQLVEWPAGDGLELALGGGRAHFTRNTQADPEYPRSTGERADGRDLTEAWRSLGHDHVYVWNSAQLAAADPDARILGLFSPHEMAFESARNEDPAGEPSLAQMTAAFVARRRRLRIARRGRPHRLCAP